MWCVRYQGSFTWAAGAMEVPGGVQGCLTLLREQIMVGGTKNEREASMLHTMNILTQDGDVTHRWDPSKPDEVAHARSTFDLFRGKGYLAYRITGSGGQGEQLREFDAHAGSIILAPQLRGG